MIGRIETWRYKCLRNVSVSLAPFNILIGPNASGKSSFLDSLAFIRDALEGDIEKAVRKRANSLRELIWKQEDVERGFEIAVEANIPENIRPTNGYDRIRYEIGVGLDGNGSINVSGENLLLVDSTHIKSLISQPPTLFPFETQDIKSIVRPAHSKKAPGQRLVVRKVAESGNDYFRSERSGWNIMLRFKPQRLALAGIPEDQDRFPLALWFKETISQNVQVLQLNSVLMHRACPSDAPRSFQPDGSNLPVMVNLLKTDPERFKWWIGHLQTILEDLQDVTVAERPEDRSYYLMVTYRNGLSVPAWTLSDGTLRLLALTLIAYLPDQDQVFIIEEPENGIHPKAVEAVFKSLTSVYDGQVFLATHSPLILALGEPKDLLVFAKTGSGATAVVRGPEHPVLREWKKETPLETLFAAGVLG